MKPSDFLFNYPYDSVFQNSESEKIARNIMVILKRKGDVFQELTWEDYKNERLKDGGFSEKEKRYFDKVIEYCKNQDTAKSFSKYWFNEKAFMTLSEAKSILEQPSWKIFELKINEGSVCVSGTNSSLLTWLEEEAQSTIFESDEVELKELNYK